MKQLIVILGFSLSLTSYAQTTFSGQLSPEDQKFYKNESAAGMNQLERIDSTVKEINKIYAELISLKSEVATLKKEVAVLKAKK